MDTRFRFPTIGAEADGRALLLAIDNVSLPFRSHLGLTLSKPAVREDPVLKPRRDDPNATDQIGTHFYGSVLHDEGRFRMWYYAASLGAKPKTLRTGPVCYAESDDGINWSRPNLGQAEFKGSKDNNAINLPASEEGTAGVNVIKDPDDPDPQRRYKMVYNDHNGEVWTFRPATSPDGLHWNAQPLPVNRFIEMGSLLKHGGLYIVHGQSDEFGEIEGYLSRRGYAAVSPDFSRWNPAFAEAFLLPEPVELAERGYQRPHDQVHLGVGATSFGNVAVGLYGLWHNPPPGSPQPEGWYGFGLISCDLGLLVSNDGIHFREPIKHRVFIASEESPAPPAELGEYPTILSQCNGIVNVGDETRIYHGRWRNAEYGPAYRADVALATLPRDRWGALAVFPRHAEGSVWSAPMTLPERSCEATLNADAAKAIRVEITDEQFTALPNFCGDNCGTTDAEGGPDCPVVWPRGDLSALGKKTVRLRISLKKEAGVDPKLYALTLRLKQR